MTTPSPTALVIGAGIAGLASAIVLERAGFSVRVVDRAPVLAPIGAALSMWANAVDALDQLGVGPALRDQGTRIDQMAVFTRDGRPVIGPHQVNDSPYPGARSYMVTRAALQSVLLAAIDPACLMLGVAMTAITQDAGGVSVQLDTGTSVSGDIAIIADGIWSSQAGAMLGGKPRHAGYGGVLALSDTVAGESGAHAAHEYWGLGARFGVFDIGGGRRYWFYMRNEADSAEARLLTHAQIADTAQDWMPDIGAAIAATPADRLIPFSIHAKPPPTRLGTGRILCVGDAAHAMEPNLGQGACQAIEDAVALGVIARTRPVSAIVDGVDRLRLKRIAHYVKQSAEGARPSHSRSALTRGALKAALGMAPAALTSRVISGMYKLPDYVALARGG